MGLVARVFEREGLPTVTLSSALDISERVKPPRTAYLDFPLGNQLGPPGDPGLQRSILRSALALFDAVTVAGEIVRLPFEWPVPGWRERIRDEYRAEASIVQRQRIEGEYVDGRNVAEADCADVCSLV